MLEIFKQVEVSVEKNFDETLVNLWIKFADVRPSSQKTYEKALKQMFKYFRENKIQYPVREDIENWKSEMFKTKKASTIQLYIIAAKLFFRGCIHKGKKLNCGYEKRYLKQKSISD